MWSFWDASDLSGTYGSQVINVWKKIFFLATFWRPLNLTALWDMHRFWNKFLKNHLIFFEMGLLWWNTLSRNKIWYKLYSDIWTKLTVQAPDRTWDEDLLPFKKTSFFPLYVEYVDEIFNPHPHIPHICAWSAYFAYAWPALDWIPSFYYNLPIPNLHLVKPGTNSHGGVGG